MPGILQCNIITNITLLVDRRAVLMTQTRALTPTRNPVLTIVVLPVRGPSTSCSNRTLSSTSWTGIQQPSFTTFNKYRLLHHTRRHHRPRVMVSQIPPTPPIATSIALSDCYNTNNGSHSRRSSSSPHNYHHPRIASMSPMTHKLLNCVLQPHHPTSTSPPLSISPWHLRP